MTLWLRASGFRATPSHSIVASFRSPSSGMTSATFSFHWILIVGFRNRFVRGGQFLVNICIIQQSHMQLPAELAQICFVCINPNAMSTQQRPRRMRSGIGVMSRLRTLPWTRFRRSGRYTMHILQGMDVLAILVSRRTREIQTLWRITWKKRFYEDQRRSLGSLEITRQMTNTTPLFPPPRTYLDPTSNTFCISFVLLNKIEIGTGSQTAT